MILTTLPTSCLKVQPSQTAFTYWPLRQPRKSSPEQRRHLKMMAGTLLMDGPGAQVSLHSARTATKWWVLKFPTRIVYVCMCVCVTSSWPLIFDAASDIQGEKKTRTSICSWESSSAFRADESELANQIFDFNGMLFNR